MRLLKKSKEYIQIIVLCLLLGAGLVYSLTHDPNAGAKKLRNANVSSCQRGLAKSIVVENFMNQAASARRSSATSEQSNGETVQAANDVQAAIEYEGDAIKYGKLTPTNCSAQYPVP